MEAYVAVTDGNWYRYLIQRPDLDEVNFWQPGGNRRFGAIEVGQPFLFKLHYPDNFIVGGGFFTYSSLLPSSVAWDAFGEKNGAASLHEMRLRIEKYRRSAPSPHEDYTVGCIMLGLPFFFERGDWIPVPEDFHPNIVQGKRYDLTSGTGREIWEAVQVRLQALRPKQFGEVPATPMYGEPALTRPRLGQGGFRILVTDTYRRQCAVTREKVLPVLQAAHIRPVSEGGVHRVDNGLLLRSDVHALFDRGYVSVTRDHRFLVSRQLRDDFDNGESYYQFDRAELWVPPRNEDRPDPALLEWHTDTVFRG